jgi:aerobic carbon-monoxide dehydrogenase large subunit
MLIRGQSHGGIAQGIGQALWEACVYDPRSGQLLSGSFLDYAMPRADLLPAFETEISEVPSTTNPLGMRGGSEGGITPGLAAVANAIVDALAEFGVEHIELPVTPERVWNAARAARDRTAEGVSQSVVGEGREPVSADSNLRFGDALAPPTARPWCDAA